MEAIDLTELLLPYKNTFVAISSDQKRIVGDGPTIGVAIERASANGEAEPIIMWAPEEWTPVCV